MKTFLTLMASATIASTILAAPNAMAAKFTAKLSLDVQKGNPKEVAAEDFAKAVYQRTHGDVDIKIYPNSLLGGEADAAQGIRLGSVQMGVITSSVLTSWIPQLQILDLPYLIMSDAQAVAINQPLTKELGPKFEQQGFHLLGFSINGARNLMSTFPIHTPEDVKGKKMRVIQSPLFVATWKTVGANPVPIPAPEIYNALQTGVVDYFDNTASNYLTFKFYEVAPYYTEINYIYAFGTWVVAENWWKKLPDNYKTIVTEEAVKAQEALPAMLKKSDSESLAETAKKGATITEIKDKAPWAAAMEPVRNEFAAKIPDSKDLISIVRNAK
ncbi:Tripartite ATP-independent transporter DctP family solute receptor OS=Castellaniella defragrans OX=75697 GN=HNR28_003420 PE=3 SV=1 [Castellaniella defragrans]